MTRLPSLQDAKAAAARLRKDAEAVGRKLGQGQALEQVARLHGFRDWNAMRAAIAERPMFVVGDRVSGRYLSQPFTAVLRNVETLSDGWVRLSLDLDEAVDVVTFESFSSFRKRVQGTVGPKGQSRERTSDGTPQLEIDL
ncbi:MULTISPECIES: glyoxalase superfamily protein [Shimia]|uniref:glyoxalase superfamily protein n=1 Tax=Shimia TaxID=573139 RepID=UPI001FB2161C|nr:MULTISPECIES: glyoxalase superfamily protein [Shimia]MDV4143543.1 glyoxalase superfamily protein [Shimia sp. FJ5]